MDLHSVDLLEAHTGIPVNGMSSTMEPTFLPYDQFVEFCTFHPSSLAGVGLNTYKKLGKWSRLQGDMPRVLLPHDCEHAAYALKWVTHYIRVRDLRNCLLPPGCVKEAWMRVPWDVLLDAESDNDSTSEWVTAYHGTNISVLCEVMASKGLRTGTLARPSNTRNSLNRRMVYGIPCHKHGTIEKARSYIMHTPFKCVSMGVLLELKVRSRKMVSRGDSWCFEDPGDVQVVADWFHVLTRDEIALQASTMKYRFGRPWKACYDVSSEPQRGARGGAIRARPSAAPGQ